jgi:ABC-2 type transport system ATP-binding protein
MQGPDRLDAMIDVRGLGKYYGPFVAIRDITFRIPRGQVVALLGPNGAGKTTVMRILTGFLAASEGTASIAGFDIRQGRFDVAARVGYLPENGPLYPDMTPLEVLRFFGEARGLSPAECRARIAAVGEQCAIAPILDKPIAKLSKGLRQRVGMAQALLHDPDVLILDEPTAGLDPVQVRHFRSHVRDLAHRKTLLVSTHILHEVEEIADRILLINNGTLVFDGTPVEFGAPGTLEDRFLELTGGAQ